MRQKEALIESNFIKLELIEMKLTKPQTVSEIAKLLGVLFIGNGNQLVTGINEIHRVEFGDLVFVDQPKYLKPGLTYFGSPAGEVREKFKEMAAIRQLAKK